MRLALCWRGKESYAVADLHESGAGIVKRTERLEVGAVSIE